MSDSIKELTDLAASFRDARNWKGVPMNTFTKYMYVSMIGLFVLIFVSFSADAASFKAIDYLITPSAKVGKYYLKMKFDDETIDGMPLYYVAYSLKKNGGYKTIHIHTGEAYSDGKKVWMFNLDYEKAGRKFLYIFDLEDQSEEFVTIYAKPTTNGISDDDYYWSMTDACYCWKQTVLWPDRQKEHYGVQMQPDSKNILLVCPSCGGKMELSEDGKEAVCPFCGNVMLIENEDRAQEEYERRMAKARAEEDIKDLQRKRQHGRSIYGHKS